MKNLCSDQEVITCQQYKPCNPTVLVFMGVSGCGKTTAGKLLAHHLQCPFYDADDYHPATNKQTMAAGVALTDTDRRPWLDVIAATVVQPHTRNSQQAVLACSALRPQYRQLLQQGSPANSVGFILLEPLVGVLKTRLQAREAQGQHFMPASLFESQLNTLEYTEEELFMHFKGDGVQQPELIVQQVIAALHYSSGEQASI